MRCLINLSISELKCGGSINTQFKGCGPIPSGSGSAGPRPLLVHVIGSQAPNMPVFGDGSFKSVGLMIQTSAFHHQVWLSEPRESSKTNRTQTRINIIVTKNMVRLGMNGITVTGIEK